jgi:hypothetical protein
MPNLAVVAPVHLDYHPRVGGRFSACVRLSAIASITSMLLLAADLVFGELVVGPAYAAVGKAPTLAASVSLYHHYSSLKAVAVTLFLASMALWLIGLITGITASVRDSQKRPAAVALLLCVPALLFILFLLCAP